VVCTAQPHDVDGICVSACGPPAYTCSHVPTSPVLRSNLPVQVSGGRLQVARFRRCTLVRGGCVCLACGCNEGWCHQPQSPLSVVDELQPACDAHCKQQTVGVVCLDINQYIPKVSFALCNLLHRPCCHDRSANASVRMQCPLLSSCTITPLTSHIVGKTCVIIPSS
jgi:hypothetical protein